MLRFRSEVLRKNTETLATIKGGELLHKPTISQLVLTKYQLVSMTLPVRLVVV
jgi:hypothetical protein